MCSISKPRNKKLGLYTPLLVPSHPWESICMDSVEVLRCPGHVMIIDMLLWMYFDAMQETCQN
jgi:hypothetical protein